MSYSVAHIGLNVLDLDRSVKFYEDAFEMTEVFRMHPQSKLDMTLCFLRDKNSETMITLVWYEDRKTAYELGENNVHIAFATDDFMQSYNKHKEMGIVCIEELKKDIYYVEDPDGYEIAVVPSKFHPSKFSAK